MPYKGLRNTMISGTPIIIFAPDVTAVVKYAKQYEWAKVITQDNISEISNAFVGIEYLMNFMELSEKS